MEQTKTGEKLNVMLLYIIRKKALPNFHKKQMLLICLCSLQVILSSLFSLYLCSIHPPTHRQ